MAQWAAAERNNGNGPDNSEFSFWFNGLKVERIREMLHDEMALKVNGSMIISELINFVYDLGNHEEGYYGDKVQKKKFDDACDHFANVIHDRSSRWDKEHNMDNIPFYNHEEFRAAHPPMEEHKEIIQELEQSLIEIRGVFKAHPFKLGVSIILQLHMWRLLQRMAVIERDLLALVPLSSQFHEKTSPKQTED